MYEGDVAPWNVNGEVGEDVGNAGKPHGRGKMTFPDGSTYEGDFDDGEPHGEGKMTFSDGSTREGVWRKGSMHDKGAKVTYCIGKLGGLRSVEVGGKMIYSFGLDTYIYEALNVRSSKITYPSGDVYEGRVRIVKKWARGLVQADETGRGKSFDVLWYQWEPDGEGKMIYFDGSTYEGRWDCGSRSGKGSYTGVWKEGIPSDTGFSLWRRAPGYHFGNEWYKSNIDGVLEALKKQSVQNREMVREITQKDKLISEKDEVIAMKDKDLASSESTLKKQSVKNSEMVGVITERDKVILEKDDVIAMKDKELASVKSVLHKEREIAERRDEEIASLKAKLKSIAQMITGEDDDEENPEAKRQRTESGRSRNATNNRASRSRARMVPVKHEDMKGGTIHCPQCNNTILHNGGCKRLTCTNHRPQYLYFCAHCKKVGEEGSEIIRCECPNGNTQADRDLAQEMRNQRSREYPEVVE